MSDAGKSKSSDEEVKAGILRTPDDCFRELPDYNFSPHYLNIGNYRVHYIDEGSRDALPVLRPHGEPSWCFLYRNIIPKILEAGYRTIAPDLIGFGRSDKPMERNDYSYQLLVDSITELVIRLDLKDITLFGQDWGGLVGLRVAAENEVRFSRIIAANTGLPTGPGEDGIILGQEFKELNPDADPSALQNGFMAWLEYSQTVPELPVGEIIQNGTIRELTPAEVAAYDAPFPEERYKAGARVLPTLVASQMATNRKAWEVFESWEKPFLTAFADQDPVTRAGYKQFQDRIPGAKGQPHRTVKNASHFLQEDTSSEIAEIIIEFIKR
jgi:haloalkane dehalogenase